MGDARKLRGDRIAAWIAVLVVHALLGWTLLRLPAPLRDTTTPDSALELVWVGAARVPNQPRVPARRTMPAASARSTASSEPAPEDAAATQARAEATPSASPSMSAAFIQQAGELAARQAPGSVQSDPFANRVVRLPGRAANTFRMRPALSLAERVAAVGKLFGGADYETDPCRSVSKSINELSQEGDSRVLQDALDYERRYCR